MELSDLLPMRKTLTDTGHIAKRRTVEEILPRVVTSHRQSGDSRRLAERCAVYDAAFGRNSSALEREMTH